MTVDALKTLAGEIAAELVAGAMNAMIRGDVTVTVHPVERRALAPAPKVKRKYKKRQLKVSAPVAALRVPPTTSDAALDLPNKRCRKCHQLGTGVRVPGTTKAVRCANCKFTWDARVKRGAKPASEPARCVRCDHAKEEHDGSGRCLSVRCVCREFAA